MLPPQRPQKLEYVAWTAGPAAASEAAARSEATEATACVTVVVGPIKVRKLDAADALVSALQAVRDGAKEEGRVSWPDPPIPRAIGIASGMCGALVFSLCLTAKGESLLMARGTMANCMLVQTPVCTSTHTSMHK